MRSIYKRNTGAKESVKVSELIEIHNQISSNRNFLETINEMNQANWHHAINALELMRMKIDSFDSIIRRVDERMGKAEILLGIQKAELVYKKKIIKTIKPDKKKRKKP